MSRYPRRDLCQDLGEVFIFIFADGDNPSRNCGSWGYDDWIPVQVCTVFPLLSASPLSAVSVQLKRVRTITQSQHRVRC